MARKKQHPGTNSRDSVRFAYDGLDRIIHEKARLGIMTSLVTRPDGISFTDLKDLCGLTDGNLNRHLEVLQDAKLVRVTKVVGKGRPRSNCQITPQGQSQFLKYLEELERVVADATAARSHAANSAKVIGRLSPT